MDNKNSRKVWGFIEAVLVLVGMIIGVGMFGIPFSFARAGFLVGTFELIILTGIIFIFHLVYAEIIEGTDSPHRVPGYVQLYLGKQFAALAWCATLFGSVGTILAYILMGSRFIERLLLSGGISLPHVLVASLFTGSIACVIFFIPCVYCGLHRNPYASRFRAGSIGHPPTNAGKTSHYHCSYPYSPYSLFKLYIRHVARRYPATAQRPGTKPRTRRSCVAWSGMDTIRHGMERYTTG